MDFDLCFTLVQPAPDGYESAVPLVLIHDGGGTSVNYYYLHSLDRAVYAIQNPSFYSGEPWEDGIPEMGATYAQLIQSHVPSGPILLGAGWSLGGMISLEIASIFSRQSSKLRVLGIVMIDSVYPFTPKPAGRTIVPHKLQFGKYTKPETQRLSSTCMAQAVEMAQTWTMPVWRGCSDETKYSRRAVLEKELSQKMRTKHPEIDEYVEIPREELASLPQTILLRCNETVPVSTPEDPSAICRVDVARELEKLGWEQYGYDFISAVLQIPGHHFNIFFDEYLDDLTSRIKVACRMLERSNI
ncbi:hypothetical protein MGYG_06529 [Nannizzia gypsea CBS 118893]|uniref:Thioesterase domain-containing protein n=1 Tax=Arthroderma gypseum (strain ATCC MYA-4604 / CBS 118893) TaxID=535722 RepID=E4UZK2_ARTGP|nr:hypothetical protein MGYG_06529 [Nannizzia gypsea CBS 118893]EFR03532.1 hypothetical protein MGYG_06529 [Nannizzia gypsea CBS 118893]